MSSSPSLLVTESDASGAVVYTQEYVIDESGAFVSSIKTVLTEGTDRRDSERAELAASLTPLTADEAAAVEAAQKADAEPTAANDGDIPFESVTDLSNNEINLLTQALRGVFTGELGNISMFVSSNARDLSIGSRPSIQTWNVSAANDADGQDGFATFQSTWIDQVVASHTPEIQEKTDSYGRRFFSFDNGINNSFTAIVFEVQGKKMLSLGDVILPLDEFFSLVSCEFKGETQVKKCEDLEILEARLKIPEHVICVFPGRQLTISKLTTDKVMTVLTHLSRVYAQPVVNPVKNEIVYSAEQATQPWYYGSLGVAFLSGLVYGASLVMGK